MRHPRTNRFIRPAIQWIFILFCLYCPTFAVCEVVVISLKDTPLNSVSLDELRKRWMGESKLIKQIRVDIIDLNELQRDRFDFYQGILGISNRQLKAYWAKQVFRGNGFPPRMLESDADVMYWISEAPNRIGYINSENLTPDFKVLYKGNSAGNPNGSDI